MAWTFATIFRSSLLCLVPSTRFTWTNSAFVCDYSCYTCDSGCDHRGDSVPRCVQFHRSAICATRIIEVCAKHAKDDISSLQESLDIVSVWSGYNDMCITRKRQKKWWYVFLRRRGHHSNMPKLAINGTIIKPVSLPVAPSANLCWNMHAETIVLIKFKPSKYQFNLTVAKAIKAYQQMHSDSRVC